MGILEIVLPILIVFAVVAVVAVLVDRGRRTPGDTEGYDRLTDSPRPPEAHRPWGVNDTYNH